MFLIFVCLWIPEAEIDSALNAVNLKRKSINFDRMGWTETEMVLPVVRKLIEEPLKGGEYSRKVISAINKGELETFKIMSEGLGINLNDIEVRIDDLQDIVEYINLAGYHSCSAFENLKERERKILFSFLPGRWENEEDSTDNWIKNEMKEKYKIKVDTAGINEDSVMLILSKVKMEDLLYSNLIIIKICLNSRNVIEGIKDDSLPVVMNTDYGLMVLGTRGNDCYKSGEYRFIFEPGGDDVYKDRSGAIGYPGDSPVSIILDINGDDRYKSKDMFSIASGFLGSSIIYDCAGDDVYRGSHYSVASGYSGTGVIIDRGGDDLYAGGIFSLGASNFGVGIIYDCGGMDTYRTLCYGEGFASTYGYSIIADLSGSDIYYAGGRYKHIPLQPGSYQSLSQGFGMGVRPSWGGGIGFLYDKNGNDFYNADIFAQGCSYWASAGFLVDGDGQDRYTATEYAQGAGIHLSYGYLMDLKGNDNYFSSYGPSMGEGHDFSCGILIDSSGNDWYSVSGGIGVGIYNSFGLFSDNGGNDVYNITEELGIGDVNTGRGFKGIGIFIDNGGMDKYPENRGGNNISWVNSDYGIGVDKKSSMEYEVFEQKPVPDFKNMKVEEVFKIASEWGVGNNKERVKRAREYLSEKGKEALNFIFKEKLETDDGLELRAIEKVLEENKDSLYPHIDETMRTGNTDKRKNIYRFIGELKLNRYSDSIMSVFDSIEDRVLKRYAIYALGKLEEKRAVDEISRSLNENEPEKITAIRALGWIKDTVTVEPLLECLNSPVVTIRSAAMNALVEFDTLAFNYIRKRIENRFCPELLVVLARTVTVDSTPGGKYRRRGKKIMYNYLQDENWRIREFAVRALNILGGKDVKKRYKLLMDSEPNPFVRGMMEKGI